MSEYPEDHLHKVTEEVRRGGAPKYHEAAAKQGKLFCRDRLALLLDEGSFVEDALLANVQAGDLPADGVVTGIGRVAGRPVCVMANDSTVKAGSWGKRTVEKILRIQETAIRLRAPRLTPLSRTIWRIESRSYGGRGRLCWGVYLRLSGLLRNTSETCRVRPWTRGTPAGLTPEWPG